MNFLSTEKLRFSKNVSKDHEKCNASIGLFLNFQKILFKKSRPKNVQKIVFDWAVNSRLENRFGK
jgi:hypothetical protein